MNLVYIKRVNDQFHILTQILIKPETKFHPNSDKNINYNFQTFHFL